MNSLRVEIERIVNSGEVMLTDQPSEIEKLNISHSILRVQGIGRFTCFPYALGLENSQLVNSLLREDAQAGCKYDLKFGTEFMERLAAIGLLVEVDDGGMVVYFREGRPVHGGRVREDGRILSKWGIGHLWEHGLWEIPTSYGNDALRFNSGPLEELEAEFEEYYRTLQASA